MQFPLFDPKAQAYFPNGLMPPYNISVAFTTVDGLNLTGNTEAEIVDGVNGVVFISEDRRVYRTNEVISWSATCDPTQWNYADMQ